MKHSRHGLQGLFATTIRPMTWIVGVAAAFASTACQMLESHPYDVDINGATGLTQKNIDRIEAATEGKRTLRFAMISDTQRHYDETVDAVAALNRRGDLDFVVHGGDLSDFGTTHEFMLQRDILQGLNVPFVCVIGNHDCLGTGEQVYRKIFGALNFAFTAGNVRFVCLNTNALEYDYSQSVPDFSFLRSQIDLPDVRVEKTVVLMHVRPGEMVFNNNVADYFQACIRQLTGVGFCLYGHEHQLAADDLFNDGIIYYQCPCIKKRIYLVFTLNADDTYTYEAVEF